MSLSSSVWAGLSPSRERARLREAYHSRSCTYNSFASPGEHGCLQTLFLAALRLLRPTPRSVLAEETYVSKRNTISHNYMLEGNLAVGGYAALLLYESGENVIVHNTIKR